MRRLCLSAAALSLLVLFAGCGSGESDTPTRGSGPERSTPGASGFDPTAQDLLFMSVREGNAEVYFRAGNDTTWVNLTRNPANDNWAEWSPDRSRIAFHTDRNGRLDIYVMDADGSNVTRLTEDEDHDYLPSWMPDGRIMFTSWRREASDTSRAQHVYVMDADGSNQERLGLANGASVLGAQVAPDGRTLVYGKTGEDETAQLWLASMDDLAGRPITSGTAFHGAPSFSPDGSALAYYASTDAGSDILVQDLATGAVDTVLTGGKHWYPRWSDDGSWMLSCSELEHGNYDILAFPVDGSTDPITLVSGSPRDCEGRWRPAVEAAPVAAL